MTASLLKSIFCIFGIICILYFMMQHRNNEAVRGLSEFNSTKIEIAKQDQRFVIEQNIENKVSVSIR